MHLVIIIVSIVICEAIAQYHIKLYNEIPLTYYYMMGLGFYGIIVYLLNKAYDHTTMSTAKVLWAGLSCVTILFIGRFFFGERVETNEWVGIMLILLGVAVTQMKKSMWLTRELNKEAKEIMNKFKI
ncbi:MAG: EamA family transporter [Pelagibacterales bacterium]|nr:EamA family transporter [Pelagibacterales bacterium]